MREPSSIARTRIAWTLKRERGRDMVGGICFVLVAAGVNGVESKLVDGGVLGRIGVCLRRSGQSRRSWGAGLT